MRDGEQTPGVSLTPKDKLEIARKLDELGVDAIEAGFAAATEGEFEAVKLIAREGLKAEIFSFARANKKDIDAVVDSDADAVFLVVPSSEIHIRHKLGKKHEDILELAEDCIQYAKDHGLKVEFGAEDATRSEEQFLKELIRVSVNAGADTVTPCDTVGVLTPEKAYAFYSDLAKSFPGVAFGVHCHDDFGMAVANSIAALRAGAKEVHTTINGIGERAGNASLEEVAAALRFLYGVETRIELSKISKVSRLVELKTGLTIPKNKAIVGRNAFSHESGIHVHGVVSNPITYEPILPEEVGQSRRIVIGKHSGTHAIQKVLKEHGYTLDHIQVRQILERVKELGDRGEKVSEYILLSIVNEVLKGGAKPAAYVEDFNFWSNDEKNRCEVKMNLLGETVRSEGESVSIVRASIDAGVSALKKITSDVEVVDYYVYFPPDDVRHPVEVEVTLRIDGHDFTGRGLGRSIVSSTLNAVAGAASQYLTLFKKQGLVSENT